MSVRTQRGHRTRDVTNEAKRQRRDKAGQWIASKGMIWSAMWAVAGGEPREVASRMVA